MRRCKGCIEAIKSVFIEVFVGGGGKSWASICHYFPEIVGGGGPEVGVIAHPQSQGEGEAANPTDRYSRDSNPGAHRSVAKKGICFIRECSYCNCLWPTFAGFILNYIDTPAQCTRSRSRQSRHILLGARAVQNRAAPALKMNKYRKIT